MTTSRTKSHVTAEAGLERSKEALQTFNTAANEAAQAVQDCCSTALKGMQDYSGKVAEFTQANIKSYVEFVHKLATVKSPSDFIQLSTDRRADLCRLLSHRE